MVTLEINGKQVQTEEGTNILEAAARADIDIPHFCYHPGLPIAGNCRMCLVEIENIPKLQIACATPVREGMKVFTETDKVVSARRGVLEFLLINHPIDCPICDQAGECSLQNYYQKYGLYQSQFTEEKVHKGKVIDLGGDVMLDQERCVLCGRCVRFLRDVVGDEQLGITKRGDHCQIQTLSGHQISTPYSGNLHQICPVGALTSKDFRFACRVWNMTSTPSICPGCATGCNIMIDHHKNRVFRLRARPNPDVNRFWMCDPGRMIYKNLYDEHRYLTCLKRTGQGVEHVAFNTVIAEIGNRLNTILTGAAAREIAVIGGGSLSNEEAFMLHFFANEVLQTSHVDSVYESEEFYPADNFLIRGDRHPNSKGTQDMGLLPKKSGMKIRDMLAAARRGSIRALIVAGVDLFDKPSQEKGVIQALENIDLIVCLMPSRNRMADYAHYILPTTLWAEDSGTFTNEKGRIQMFRQAVTPPNDDIKPVYTIVNSLAASMGHELPYREPRTIFEAIAATVSAYQGLSYDRLGTQGCTGQADE